MLCIFLLERWVGVLSYQTVQKYYKHNNDPLTFRQILIRSGIGTIIILGLYLLVAFQCGGRI